MRPRTRVLEENGRLNLNEFAGVLPLSPGSKVAVVPIGKGLYVAPLPKTVERRKDGQAKTKELLQHAMRAMIGQ